MAARLALALALACLSASIALAWRGPLDRAALAAAAGVGILGFASLSTRAGHARRRGHAAADPRLEDIAAHHPELVEPGRDIAFRCASDGRFEWIDERSLGRFGVAAADVPSLRLEDFLDERSLERARAHIEAQRTRRGIGGGVDLLVHPVAGEPAWVEWRIRMVESAPGREVVEGVSRDITARKAQQAAIAIQLGVAAALADARDDTGLRATARILCRELDHEYAELWWTDGDTLACAASWHGPDPDLARCSGLAAGVRLSKGRGLAGRVWAEAGARRLDLEGDCGDDARRFAEAGIERVLGLPIRQLGRVLGVALLASRGRRSRDWMRLPALELLGERIGHLVEQRRTEVTLREAQSRVRAAFEAALDGMITADHEGKVLALNPAAERILGHSRAQAVGRTVGELFVPPELRDRYQAALRACVESSASRLAGRRLELEALRADGTRALVEISIAQVAAGPAAVFTATLRDISDRKDLERLKDELVSTVSHELRTPLASLRGFVELLLMREYPEAERRKFLGIIDEEITRLTKLLNEFLDLQRLEAAATAPQLETGDLCRLVAGCVDVVRAASSRHSFAVDLPRAPLLVEMEVDRIKQAVLNLLSNAVKYSPEGGEVNVRCRRVGGTARVSVRDHGVGMSSATLEKLFTKFFRADSSLTRSIGGTGLGLALVKSIADAHGGDVSVTSKLGTGSEFSLELPLSAGGGVGDGVHGPPEP